MKNGASNHFARSSTPSSARLLDLAGTTSRAARRGAVLAHNRASPVRSNRSAMNLGVTACDRDDHTESIYGSRSGSRPDSRPMLMSPPACGTHVLDVGISYHIHNTEPVTLRSCCKYQDAFQHSENRACVLHLCRCLPVGSLRKHRANSTRVARHTSNNLLPRNMSIMFEERCGSSTTPFDMSSKAQSWQYDDVVSGPHLPGI